MSENLDPLEHLTAEERAEFLALHHVAVGGEGLAAFIARVSPHHPPPRHLAPLIALLERARTETGRRRIRALISYPPRHAKTTTIQHAVAWWLSQVPRDTCAYYSYNEAAGLSKSARARDLAVTAGVQLSGDTSGKAEWRTRQGGGCLAGGVGSGLTGFGVSGLMVIDDPIKDSEEANSQLVRDKVNDWFSEVALTRLEDAPCFVVGTRWHPDDLIGRLTKQGGWEVINLPAIAEDDDPLGRAPGEALWPERYPVEELEGIRRQIGEFSFASLYQGRPRPRGMNVFGEPTHYDLETFSTEGCKIVLAADPAATAKTTADYSVAIALYVRGSGADAKYFVRDVYRRQVEIPAFVDALLTFQQRHGGGEINVESVGGFKAVPQMLRTLKPGIRIREIVPVGDKFTRAQGVAAAWNEGRVLVPTGAPWLGAFLEEITSFTGVNDRHDDQVDALSMAFNHGRPARSMLDDDALEGFGRLVSGLPRPPRRPW